ncbi:MAG TPA: class I SAM-dependent methyltransferase [Acetobacteraceae bacterium]|nr:class I SAM-dependent methyltransferase [Acetobacteraceae bacterium]
MNGAPAPGPFDPVSVQVTADALVELRLHHPLARELGLPESHDRLFWTEQGRTLAGMAAAVDPVYEQYNLVRYRWFCERMGEAAARMQQILLLGAGLDTRALTLPAFARHAPSVFEIDLPATIAQKRAVLAQAGIAVPPHVHFVAADLGSDDLSAALDAAGYRAAQPTAVFAEGVLYFLPRATAAAAVSPAHLRLAPGSTLACDLWSATRQAGLDRIVRARTGRALFGEAAFGDSVADAARWFEAAGYGDVTVTPLARIAAQYGLAPIADPHGEGWRVVMAGFA